MPVEFRSGPASGSAEDQLMADALHDAGQYVYETFAAPLFDYCAGLLGDQLAATDAVQDSLIAVDAQTSRQPEPDQLRMSLYVAARRQCLGRLRGRWFRPASAPAPVGAPGPGGTAVADPFLAPATDGVPVRTAGETLPIVTAALARLPDRDREVLNLAFRHGFEGADLAAVLGLSSRRAESLLSGASTRFGQSAAAVVVLRAGEAGCPVLVGIVSQQDAVPAPLDSKLVRLNRHTESCPACRRVLGDRAFSPDLISQVPLTLPVGRLRLRIIRTTLALGAYRRKTAVAPDSSASGAPESPPAGAQRA
jgi:DNA-directed RNA polymerase specialized sigma24 family protein